MEGQLSLAVIDSWNNGADVGSSCNAKAEGGQEYVKANIYYLLKLKSSLRQPPINGL
ncbi:hypothetical protein F2P79_001767 [Pimephales promelas]|nr:hypothetical protein F2P79_001767 [Pimephales promelas]